MEVIIPTHREILEKKPSPPMKSACEVIKKDKAPGSKAIGFFGSGWFWGSLGNYQVVLDFSSLFSGG